ncbi:hypothetical protein A2U01_0018521 [Trifolium medium]|uniref:Uncharacterized protein n=1 Tax=Trifolium medium TaxID=97028 RepID=A0A392NCE0_9FABA|nr:hypothetical protein [Trifolium medium]
MRTSSVVNSMLQPPCYKCSRAAPGCYKACSMGGLSVAAIAVKIVAVAASIAPYLIMRLKVPKIP